MITQLTWQWAILILAIKLSVCFIFISGSIYCLKTLFHLSEMIRPQFFSASSEMENQHICVSISGPRRPQEGHTSVYRHHSTGVPQGCVLRLLFSMGQIFRSHGFAFIAALLTSRMKVSVVISWSQINPCC